MTASSNAHRRRGYTMLVVLIFLSVGLILVGVNQRRIGALLRIEQAALIRSDLDEGPVQAMSRAVELLETGHPPQNAYTCWTSVTTSTGVKDFRVAFYRIYSSGDPQWWIIVNPLSPYHSLPPMPVTFAS